MTGQTDQQADRQLGDVSLAGLTGVKRPISEWTTTFPMALVVLDPYTHESSWLLDTARRILGSFSGANVTAALLVSGADGAGAARFLGPLADEVLGLVDPDGSLVRSLGLASLPAFVVIRQDGSVAASVEGWDPGPWREAVSDLADLTAWSRPEIPAPGDPAPYAGTPVPG